MINNIKILIKFRKYVQQFVLQIMDHFRLDWTHNQTKYIEFKTNVENICI